MRPKILVILANLGGPDSPVAVRPFLFNLFYDRAILNLPNPLRYILAWLIASFRYKKASGIYSLIGGKSPILENTLIQAKSLKTALEGDFEVLVVPAMRYWRPRAKDALAVASTFRPDGIVFLPLYPQFSTTTTKSSIDEWKKIAPEWQSKTVFEKCHYKDQDFVRAHQELIRPIFERATQYGAPRILFSAHGLPQKVVDAGDPYQKQVEATVASIMQELTGDFVICYQSKVGPLKWLGPSIDEEIKKVAFEKKPVVVVPVSFVSEHSETLVELDIDYAIKAKELGAPFYGRVPALGNSPWYIKCLENSVRKCLKTISLSVFCVVLSSANVAASVFCDYLSDDLSPRTSKTDVITRDDISDSFDEEPREEPRIFLFEEEYQQEGDPDNESHESHIATLLRILFLDIGCPHEDRLLVSP